MRYILTIRKRAEKHITETYNWYEKQRTGLGSEFVLSVESVLTSISRDPFIFQTTYQNIRCALIPRFPFGIFYFVIESKIIVISVFHLSRNPKLWNK